MKLYYDCPIEACYMAKYFGVKYSGEIYIEAEWFADGTYAFYSGSDEEGTHYYILPDSLPIFEPRVGDMVTSIGNRGYWIDWIEGDKAYHAGWKREPAEMYTVIAHCKIIQRNNRPFIMPKEEV